MQVTRNALDTAVGPADWFTGSVYIDTIAVPVATARAGGALVHFTPGARTAWHTHPHGQTIYVIEGSRSLPARRRRSARRSVPATASISSRARTTGTGPPPIA